MSPLFSHASRRLSASPAAPLVLLTMLLAGCGSESPSSPATATRDTPPPAAGNMWVTSDDGMLALRFSVAARRVAANESIQAVGEIRNASDRKLTVLRPFGDWYTAKATGMKIWDGEERQVRYTGAAVSYVIGPNGF